MSLPNVSDLKDHGWRELRSPDFTLYSRGSKADLEAFALDLSRFVAVVDRLVQSQPPKTGARVFLVDERAEKLFMRGGWVEGFMSHSLTGFDGMVRGTDHDPIVRGVFLHEFTHYLTLRNRNLKLPPWYIEGFAEFLGPTRTRGDVVEVGSAPPWRLRILEYRRRRGRPIDLAEIFSSDRKRRLRDVVEFYAISWATVHYLNSNPDRQKRMLSMLERQARGMDWESAYAESFEEPIEDLSARVERHVEILSKGTPGALLYLPIEELPVRSEFEIRAIPPAEATQLLGEVALREAALGTDEYTQRLSEALFERSLELDPDDSRTHAALASSLSAQEQFEDAEAHLVAFRSDPDPSVEALVHAGNATQRHALHLTGDESAAEREGVHAAAIELYRRALVLQSNHPAALAGMGLSQLETNDLDAARNSLALAQSHGEWDAELTLNQGRVERAAGRIDRAREFLNQVIRLGNEDDAKRAMVLLESMYTPE